MSDDEYPNARNSDPETSHLAAAEVKKIYLVKLEAFFRSHDNDPGTGWTSGEVFDTEETGIDYDNIWKRSAELLHRKKNPVLEWVFDSDGNYVQRRWQGSGKLQRARRIIREKPAEKEPASMIDPGLIDEAYKAYQEIAVLAPLRAQSPFVPGDGPLNAPVLLVGEAPGEQEALQLKPFVGPSGRLLDKLLAEVGWLRWMCYVTNVVLYRPPGNRKPERFEIHVSRPRLMAEIQGIDPGLVITLGATARQALVPDGLPVSECHGQWEQWNGRWLLPTYHPSAALRDERVLVKMRADLAFLKQFSPLQPDRNT